MANALAFFWFFFGLLSIRLTDAAQPRPDNQEEALLDQPSPDFTFSQEWQILGPFEIGTREVTWGADPLEFYGGFHSLKYDPNATFRSSLVFNARTTWSKHDAKLSYKSNQASSAELDVAYPDIDWQWLRSTYGWAALQWQAWARGEIYVEHDFVDVLTLDTPGLLEYWIDDQHYFGGDFYGYRTAPVTLHLSQGVHRVDVRLVRDVRAMGGLDAYIKISLKLKRSTRGLVRTNPKFDEGVLISDAVGGDYGPLTGRYASVMVRNDAGHDISVIGIDGMRNKCVLGLVSEGPIKLVPGQTRPIAFGVGCTLTYDRRIEGELVYRYEGTSLEHTMHLGAWPDAHKSIYEPHKITYLGPGGVVSYGILRAPSLDAQCDQSSNQSAPVLIALHGAGVDVDSDVVRSTFDDLADLCAWVLIPSGVTTWSGDDWHVWGLADVEAAVAAIPQWIEAVEWTGPGVDVERWFVSGHSNGGQGVWHVLTHRPDKVIAAAALSGYSSIQNYVPYSFWHTSDPGREAVVQSALLSYRHELLLENAKDIPVFQQHGNLDDNVPVYHSRLLAQRIQQAGTDSTYFEVPGMGHVWDGMMATEPMSRFFNEQLEVRNVWQAQVPLNLRDFTMVVAGDMESKNGVKVDSTMVPGKLAKLHFLFDPFTLTCVFDTINVLSFRIGPNFYDDCQDLLVDGQSMLVARTTSQGGMGFVRSQDGWRSLDTSTESEREQDGNIRHSIGGMNAILRSKGAFSIVHHSPNTGAVALQISRNLCQYYGADTDITKDYSAALNASGNIFSIAISDDLPDQNTRHHHIFVNDDGVTVDAGDQRIYGWSRRHHRGLAAIYLRPLPDQRLELVVWGIDAEALKTAARLVPMLTGSGQPDFVVADETMLSKGLEGTLALGFFDSYWEVSQNSYLAV
ncbi:uncharacterized protein LTR77_002694 [Saxophila tyrrhenica]|uniref:Peptidase S9 prolyl oligopeptidase catalytic domain-containing protein n=1 Tax=Saxophila tyrrhenica TaxID=1690608 RepID=A0AAV9PFD6_9PEZI|nr:hypothetical protein LTR77_002694 [Saxophila tyrrhenica]